MTMHYDNLDSGNWAHWHEAILDLETEAYEASRRDRPETLQKIICDPHGASLAAIDGDRLAGFCLGAPLELFAHVRGPAEDSGRGDMTVLYSADTCVSPTYRGKGVGRELKTRQLTLARSVGYQLIAGRNRAGLANAMWQLNRSLGARAVHIIEKDYGDGIEPDICIYYHIKLDREISEHGPT